MLLPVADPSYMRCASQGRKDWETFLLHRARELSTGIAIIIDKAVLLMHDFCIDDAPLLQS